MEAIYGFLILLKRCPNRQNRFWKSSELHQEVKCFRYKDMKNALVSGLNRTLIASIMAMKFLVHVHNSDSRHGEAHRICILVCILDMNSAARRLQVVIRAFYLISFDIYAVCV